jgi:transcription initiation factor TFIIIB Brf1 subunit/transcription initiation factor TFIIB
MNELDVEDTMLWSMFVEFSRSSIVTSDSKSVLDQQRRQSPCHCGCISSSDPLLVDGQIVCSMCSTILDRQIDYSAEWRCYGNDEGRVNPTRCCPVSLVLGSVVSVMPRRRTSYWQNRTAATAAATVVNERVGRSLQRYQVWNTISYRERVINKAFDAISMHMTIDGMPMYLMEEAKSVYRRVLESGSRGHTRIALVAASVYIACSRNEVPRSLKETSSTFNVPIKALIKACRTADTVIGFSPISVDTNEYVVASTPMEYVGRFCSRLNFSPDDVSEVRRVLSIADSLSIVCNAMPPTIAAGTILLVSKVRNLGLSAEDVGKVCMMSPVTVFKLMKRLMEHAKTLGLDKTS